MNLRNHPESTTHQRAVKACGAAGFALAAGLLLLATALPARASQVIVPDAYATIGAALASGADTVSVRPGAYPESLVVSRPVVVRGLCAGGTWGVDCALDERPVVGSAGIGQGILNNFQYQLLHLHFMRAVNLQFSGTARDDQFDHGLFWGGLYPCRVIGCQCTGDMSIQVGFGSVCDSNVVTGGTLSAGSQGSMAIIGNTIVGPAVLGLGVGEDAFASSNVIRGCTDGLDAGSNTYIYGNVVEDCTGRGFVYGCHGCYGGTYPSYFSGNVARRCGGRGFELWGQSYAFLNNLVDGTGQEGVFFGGSFSAWGVVSGNTVLHAGGVGILAAGGPILNLRGNVVLYSGGDGVSVLWSDTLMDNIVGRSQGRGLVTRSDGGGGYRVQRNTVYLNGGAGIDLLGGSNAEVDSITNNIGYGNATGLHWAIDPSLPSKYTPAVPHLSCNDWIGNSAGDVSGTPASPLDIAVDPSFCGLATDDVTLTSDSPLAALAGCGQVGARGVGCTGSGPTAVLASLASCRVANGHVELAWQFSGAVGTSVTIERTTDRTSWSPLAVRTADGAGRLAFADADVVAGATYGYRLAWLEAGHAVTAATTFVTVPSDARLAVRVLGMTGGVADVDVVTPGAGEARVELFDVLGRRADGRVVQADGPGATRLSLGRSLPPGLYLVAVRFGGQSAHARVLVLR